MSGVFAFCRTGQETWSIITRVFKKKSLVLYDNGDGSREFSWRADDDDKWYGFGSDVVVGVDRSL